MEHILPWSDNAAADHATQKLREKESHIKVLLVSMMDI